MHNTLVIQSHRATLPYPWIEQCIDSVRRWCEFNNYDYHFLNDELFDYIPGNLQKKLNHQKVIASDLARLFLLQKALDDGHAAAVWLDVDFLIFDPEHFVLPDEPCAVGREVWVQRDKQGKLKVYKKVHNALLMFRQANSFLAFYRDTAERLLLQNRGTMPPQFIGPKLLTAMHNIAGLPVMESAGMLSPLVIRDIVSGKGEALQRFVQQSPVPISGANLCISSRDREEINCAEIEQVISILIEKKMLLTL